MLLNDVDDKEEEEAEAEADAEAEGIWPVFKTPPLLLELLLLLVLLLGAAMIVLPLLQLLLLLALLLMPADADVAPTAAATADVKLCMLPPLPLHGDSEPQRDFLLLLFKICKSL